jgi:hypothetical protein
MNGGAVSTLLSTKIACQDFPECRHSTYLVLEDNGEIRMDGGDIGPAVAKWWGGDDYEYIVTVPPAAAPRLAYELLREKFSGPDAVDAFRTWCQEHGVEHKFLTWR